MTADIPTRLRAEGGACAFLAPLLEFIDAQPDTTEAESDTRTTLTAFKAALAQLLDTIEGLRGRVREVCAKFGAEDIDELESVVVRKGWDGIMTTLDDIYPESVFDGSSGDPGPAIVVLTRKLAELEGRFRAERLLRQKAEAALCEAIRHPNGKLSRVSEYVCRIEKAAAKVDGGKGAGT
jgi:hypothetical protein